MDLHAWLVFVVAETLLCFAPGPAVLMVVSSGMTRGVTAATYAALGTLVANAIYFLLSAIGVGTLIMMSHDVFHAVRWIGVAYLIWIGVQTFRGGHPALSASGQADAPVRRGAIFRAGLIMKLADPKTMFYFVALLPQFIDPSGDVALQVTILGITSVVIEFAVLMFYGGLAGRLNRFARSPRVAAWTDRIAGSFLIAAGIGMAMIRKEE
jgi:homoserine/homoserine lactone efflux protein